MPSFNSTSNLARRKHLSIRLSLKEKRRLEARADLGRVGNNPLLIKAHAVKGAYKADAVISSDDANKVLSDKALKEHLKKCRVVFVVS